MRWRAWLRLAGAVGALSLVAVAAMLVVGRWILKQACYYDEAREGTVYVKMIGMPVAALDEEWTGGTPIEVRHRRTGGTPGIVVDATACAHRGRATLYVSE